jgi:hypothetical protein
MNQFTRKPGWQGRLAAHIDGLIGVPFTWGSCDCSVGLVSGSVYALTLEDIAEGWAGQYTDAAGAMALLRSRCYKTVEERIAELFECRPSVAFAARGDIAVIDGEHTGIALGVFDTPGIAVMTEMGRGFIPRAKALRAYQVG